MRVKKKLVWSIVGCLTVAALVLASCAPAVVEEEEEKKPVVEEEKPVVEEEKPVVEEKEVTPEKSLVISYQEVSQEGTQFKLITGAEEFGSYEEAEDYLLSQESDSYRIVSSNPFISPVPLEAVESYNLTYSSNSTVEISDVGAVPAVKIFEYIGE